MKDTYKGQVDNPLTLNRYVYTANNPLRYIDASGHEYTEIGNSLTSHQRRMNVMLDQKTTEAYINLYRTYGPEAIPKEDREIIGMLADPSTMIPGAGGIKIVRNAGKYVITAVNGAKIVKSRYSGGLIKVTKPDSAADALAKRIGGESRVRFANDTANREFDVISSQFIAQTKPAVQTVNKSLRDQMKATFEAAKDTGRSVYYHFEGNPAQSVIDKLHEYSERYGIEVVIDTIPLK